MANNTKRNLERVAKIIDPKIRNSELNAARVSASSASPLMSYETYLGGATESSGITESVVSKPSYNSAAPASATVGEAQQNIAGTSGSGEAVASAPSYNSGYKTDTVMTYTDYINSQEQSVIDKYNSDVDYAGKIKEDAYEKAEDQLNIAMRDAQSNYKQNDPRYGATAENLLGQGLGDSGYGEYLAGKREEQLSNERMAANSQFSYAKRVADENYDTAMYNAEQSRFASQQTLYDTRANYQLQLDEEFKAAYNEIVAAVAAGTYSAELGEKILSQYAGGSVSANIVSALKSAELKASLTNEKSAATAITEWLAGLGVAPTEEQFRYTLSQMGLPETAIDNYVAAAFKDGEFVGDLTSSGNSSGGSDGGSSGGTIVPDDDNDNDNETGAGYPDGYDAYVSDESLLEQFKKTFGREPTEEEWNYAKTKMVEAEGGWYFNSENDFYDIFGISRPNNNVGGTKSYSSSEIISKAVGMLDGVGKREVDGRNTLASLLDSLGQYILSGKTDKENITEEEQKTFDALRGMADGLIISSFDFNLAGSEIRYDKVGDNFSIVGADGSKYRVENGGKANLSDISEEDSATISSLTDGVVFGYKGELYVKASDGAYILRARSTLMTGSYGNLWKAVYTEAIKDVLTKGVTNNSAGIKDNTNNRGEASSGAGDYFNNLSKNESTELDSSLADKVVISSARYNVLGSKIRADKVGDNFSINMGEKTYRVENEGIVSDNTVLSALNSTAGIYDGDVIAYGGELYLKGDKTWYKLGARDLFMKGSFKKLKEAIYKEANTNLQNTNHGAGVDISNMGSYERGLNDKSEGVSTDGASGRGYAWASKINPGATDGEGWITVNVNGGQYRVKLNGEASGIDATGVNEREVFLKNGEAYLKMDGKIYNVDKRFLGGVSYNNMVKAIAENFGDQVGSKYAGNAIDLHAVSITKVSNLKYNSQVKVGLGGGQYKFDVDAVLGSDSDAYKAAEGAGIASGSVFAHGEDIYIMGEGECYKLGARDVFNNRDYDDFKAAVTGAVQNKDWEEVEDENGNKSQQEMPRLVSGGSLNYQSGANTAEIALYLNNKNVKVSELNAEKESGNAKEAVEKLSAEDFANGVYTYKGHVYLKHAGKVYIVQDHQAWRAAFESTESQREAPFGNLWDGSGSVGSSPPPNAGGSGPSSEDIAGIVGGGSGGNSNGTSGGIDLTQEWYRNKLADTKLWENTIPENSKIADGAEIQIGDKFYNLEEQNLQTNKIAALLLAARRGECGEYANHIQSSSEGTVFYLDSQRYYCDTVNNKVYLLKTVLKDSSETPQGNETQSESGWDKITKWFKTVFGNKEEAEEYVDEDLDVTRGLASFETDGRLFDIDRGLVKGDNFTVEIDGKSYAVESGGEVDSSKATNLYRDAGDVANGEVFLYGDGMYLKKGGKIYEVDARKLFGKGQAAKLQAAIKSNSAEGEGGSQSVYESLEAKANISAINFNSGKYDAFDKITLQDKLGKEYKLQVRAVLGMDSAAYKAAVAEGNNVADGQLFRHGQDFYIKDGNTVLKMSATGGAHNGDYDKLVNLDAAALDETLVTRSHNAEVNLSLFNDTVTIYTESGEYSSKKEQNVSGVERIKEIAKDVAAQSVFAIGDRLYYKATDDKIWLLEDNQEMLASIKNGINPFECGENATAKSSGISTYYDTGKLTSFNNMDKAKMSLKELELGKPVGIILDGGKYVLKCGYRSTEGAHQKAIDANVGEGELFTCNGFLYVYLSDGSILLTPSDTTVNKETYKYQDEKYLEIVKKLEEKSQGNEISYSSKLRGKSAKEDNVYSSYSYNLS